MERNDSQADVIEHYVPGPDEERVRITNGVVVHTYPNGAVRIRQPEDTPPEGVWLDRRGQEELCEVLTDD